MPDFVQLWVYLSSAPLFGLTATLTVYLVAQAFYLRVGQAPWANPVLLSIILLGGGLYLSRVSYQTYFAGAQFIHFLLGPAVVALAGPLWQRRAELMARWREAMGVVVETFKARDAAPLPQTPAQDSARGLFSRVMQGLRPQQA